MNINGGFEQGFLGWPVHGAEWAVTSDAARSGGSSAKRTGQAGGGTLCTGLMACAPGQHIEASAYVMRDGATGSGQVRISFRDSNGAELSAIDGDEITFNEWRQSIARAEVPAGAGLFRIELNAGNDVGTDIYFDDVTLSVREFGLPAPVDMEPPVLPDPRTLGRSRVATQYTSSERFLAYLNALLDPLSNVQAAMLLNLIQTDVEQARGVNLDTLGEIVGVSRIVPNAIAQVFFGFFGSSLSAPFGELGRLQYGARFRELSESGFASTVLQDPEYRLLVKARIIRNHSRGTNEDIMRALAFLLNIDVIIIDDNGGMEIGITFGRQLTATEISMMDDLGILPRPAAVKVRRRMMFLPGDYFGFDGQPKALPFGEEGVEGIGGPLAEEF